MFKAVIVGICAFVLLLSCEKAYNPGDIVYNPEFVSLDNASVTLQTTTTTAISRSAGLSKTDPGDSLSFRSSSIDFWGIQSNDDIDNLYTQTMIEMGAGPRNKVVNESVMVDLGDRTWTFSSSESNIYLALENVTLFPTIVNLIRIDIGAGILDIYDDGVKIDKLFDIGGKEYTFDWDGETHMGLNCNSILLVDEKLLTVPYYAPRGCKGISDPLLSDAEEFLVNKVLDQSGLMDVDGALFLPLNPVEILNPESVNEILIDFSWQIDGAIQYDGSRYVMADRTGNGIAFDFGVDIILR